MIITTAQANAQKVIADATVITISKKSILYSLAVYIYSNHYYKYVNR